ncbi:MAG: hypothetical protein JWN93_632 [Hyphomicrobiales bacterium]|nr:hypothetical protein [Hyphomicrobiales bacterium]
MSSFANLHRYRPRLVLSATAGLLAGLLLPGAFRATTRVLVGWDVGALLYLAIAWTMMARSSAQLMLKRAAAEDESALAILGLTAAAAVASLAAIAVELAGARSSGTSHATPFVFAGITVVCSWFFVHTVFAIHYAHDYYGTRRARGLAFPDETAPDYGDFLYFAFTIGAAAQTSDVSVTGRAMRRLVLAHTVLSFFFNTAVLALAINVGAGLI